MDRADRAELRRAETKDRLGSAMDWGTVGRVASAALAQVAEGEGETDSERLDKAS